MNPPGTALVIDDEPQLRRLLRLALVARGYEVFEADSGQSGLTEVAYRHPDVILLDLGLPDMGGLEVLRKLREWCQTPVLILSVRDEESTKVTALDSGADDYVTKPFSTAELISRLSAIQRRRTPDEEVSQTIGSLTLNYAHREVKCGEQHLRLSPIEYQLLRLLARHQGKILTSPQILREVWGPQATEQAQYLRVYIGHLRRKLEHSRVMIQNEPGIGYRLREVQQRD